MTSWVNLGCHSSINIFVTMNRLLNQGAMIKKQVTIQFVVIGPQDLQQCKMPTVLDFKPIILSQGTFSQTNTKNQAKP